MKIILKEDVDNLGGRGKILSVKDGYARNYLIPKALAMRYTPGAEKVLQQERRRYDTKKVRERDEAASLAERLGLVEITLSKRVGDQDTLYGSVTPTELAEILESKGFEIDKRKIQIRAPIKKLGDYEVPVKLHSEVTTSLRLHVVKEE